MFSQGLRVSAATSIELPLGTTRAGAAFAGRLRTGPDTPGGGKIMRDSELAPYCVSEFGSKAVARYQR
jgi:hypothetical protein